MRGSEQDWIHSSEQTSGNLHKLFHKSGSISDSEDHFDFLLWLNVGSLKRIPAVGARRQPVRTDDYLWEPSGGVAHSWSHANEINHREEEAEFKLCSEGPAEPRSMAPKGPPMQEDVIDEQEGKGLIARPCRGSPCGARGPGSVPALTSVRAQMTPVLS
ncbi:Formate-dependent phosphoribosylglycinamide formyltransferase [Dissostichus eleginoides]|uniref:Formate-dependent phosphoribosylglycinamide formyltransferase n=1 Tax=Dissostichus eleginoides TaxID=100907 RepID=A0AAD9FGY4_DISEL|nr:Formate-dependent phosphoribosylglycinamide formyltransferase [Dissostichus eleginoides]